MNPPYVIENGKVRTRSLEAHIVDHCNLRCALCCSLSPHLPRWHVEPESLAAELDLAGRVLEPTWFKLVGGEPLLHPRLLDCLAAARGSGIAEIVSLTTNGFLLPRQPTEFWEQLDALTVSLYPVPALPAETIALIDARAAEFGVRLNWKHQDAFVGMDRAERCGDEEENREVWSKCWLRRRCHMIRGGRFYACTRPAHFQALLGEDFTTDGVPLHEGPTLAAEIADYLNQPAPLRACSLCLGGDAPSQPHRPLRRGEAPAFMPA